MAVPPNPTRPAAPKTQLMTKGQWSSTAAMGNYLHDDDEGKQDAQMKRMKRRTKYSKG